MMSLGEVANRAFANIFPYFHTGDLADIFLIGKALSDRDSFRARLRNQLPSSWGLKIRIHYPEHLFNELINISKVNMLDLENTLAQSVHAVIICLESPGAIAELGAFANHTELCTRLIVVIDRKHKGSRSFIRLGPVRLLEKLRNDSVLWWDMEDTSEDSMKKVSSELRSRIRKRFPKAGVSRGLQNPLVAESFFLLFLYLVESATVRDLRCILERMAAGVAEEAEIICRAALQSLFSQGWVTLAETRYVLTRKGLAEIRKRVENSGNRQGIWRQFDEMRVEVLNSSWRTGPLEAERWTNSSVI